MRVRAGLRACDRVLAIIAGATAGGEVLARPRAWFADELGISAETAKSALCHLRRMGLVESEARFGGNGAQEPNAYRATEEGLRVAAALRVVSGRI